MRPGSMPIHPLLNLRYRIRAQADSVLPPATPDDRRPARRGISLARPPPHRLSDRDPHPFRNYDALPPAPGISKNTGPDPGKRTRRAGESENSAPAPGIFPLGFPKD